MLAFTLQMVDPPSAISINHKQILSAVDVFNLHHRTCRTVVRGQCVCIDDVFYYFYCITLG